MAGGLSALAIAYIPAGGPYSDYLWQLQQYPLLNALVKFGVVFPLSYHYMGGLRHLVRRRRRRPCALCRASAAASHLPPHRRLLLTALPFLFLLLQAWDNVLPGWHTTKRVSTSGLAAVGIAGVLGVIAMGTEFKRSEK